MITNASIANVPYIGALPTMITNLGGRMQVSTVDNPFQNSSMQYIGPQGFQSFGANSGVTPQVNPYAIVNDAQSMLANVFNPMASSNIDSALGAITTQKNQLISKYNSGNVSDSVKSIIQAHVKELEKYEYQLNYLKANAGNVDPQTAYQRSEYLKNTVAGIIDLGTTTIKGLEVQSAQQAQSVDATQGDKVEDNSLEAKAQKVKNDNIYTRAGEDDIDSKEVSAQYYNSMIDNMYNAMKGWGTDDEALEAELDKINKENVFDLMYYWNQKHPEESFMEMFIADADASQKKKYGIRIADAMEAAANEAGIDLSNDEDMVAIKKEVHNSLFWINNSVADNYNNIVKKLLEGAGYEYNYAPYTILSK